MSFLIVLVLASASVLPAQAPIPVQNAVPRASAENGKKLYVARGCWQCHGYAAQGGTAGPRLAPRPIAWPAFSKYVRQPTGDMIPYTTKMIAEQELADIYAFLLTLPPPPPVSSIPQLRD